MNSLFSIRNRLLVLLWTLVQEARYQILAPLTLSIICFPLFGLTVVSGTIEELMMKAPLKSVVEINQISVSNSPETTTFALASIISISATELSLNTGDSIVIEFPGGETERGFLEYSGVAYPIVGIRYRAYLKPTTRKTYSVVGFEKGFKRLGARQFVRNNIEGCNSSNPAYIHWARGFMPIPYFIAIDSFRNQPELIDGIRSSFEAWRNIDGAGLDFVPMGCSNSMHNENDGINSIVFMTSNWTFLKEAIAVTRNFFIGCQSGYAGQILDSDILLNGEHHQFSIGPKAGHHDVMNILTHEIGHLLGLGHETTDGDRDATMWADADFLETKKRTLKTSDIEGIRESYPMTIEKGSFSEGVECRVTEVEPFTCAASRSRKPSASDLLFPAMLALSLLAGRFSRFTLKPEQNVQGFGRETQLLNNSPIQ